MVPTILALLVVFTLPDGIRQDSLPMVGGSCRGVSSAGIDNSKVLFLRNTKVFSGSGETGSEISVQGENVIIERMVDGTRSSRVINVAEIIDPNQNIDLDLMLTIIDGHVGVYWRETFQNQSYRQGLAVVDGSQLVARCDGRGGQDVDG